ncbi:MAG TPA: AAA family ATPase [Anaerolineae bacterium]|nr:AAA family ATPase [Anaerolineae bacterium]
MNQNDLKNLPLGLQTFPTLIKNNYLYIDKTEHIYTLIQRPHGRYFLARPRRFGKSLLVSTLITIFNGQKELFQNLYISQTNYHWQKFPIIHLDFSQIDIHTVSDLTQQISWQLKQIATENDITLSDNNYNLQFIDLVKQLAHNSEIIILIDEYDKPILDNIHDLPLANEIREQLKNFFTIIKSLDAHLRFIFITGISRFSKAGIFSGLNNLTDLTLDNRYATLLGITETEIDTYLMPYLHTLASNNDQAIADLRQKIKFWYNGFRFADNSVAVYNPYSLFLLLEQQTFRNFWFESGTPAFLIKLLHEKQYDLQVLNNLEVSEFSFNNYELDDLRVIPLLYQTGYLTISDYDSETGLYHLTHPNYEVENAFLQLSLQYFSHTSDAHTSSHYWRLIRALQQPDLDQFFTTLNTFFANIPYDIQIKQEKYYQTIFYLIFELIGLQITAEARTNRGRIDAVIETDTNIFIFEFKLDQSPTQALGQIQQNQYAQRYTHTHKSIYLIGAQFALDNRGILDWQYATL